MTRRTRRLLLEAARDDHDGRFARVVCAALAELDAGVEMSPSDVDLLRRMAAEDREMVERSGAPSSPSVEVPLVSLLSTIDARRVDRVAAGSVTHGVDPETRRVLERAVATSQERGTGELAVAIMDGLLALAGDRDVDDAHRGVLEVFLASRLSDSETCAAVRVLLLAVAAVRSAEKDLTFEEIAREKRALDAMVDAAREARFHPAYAQAKVGDVDLEQIEEQISSLHPDREVTLSAGTLRAIVARVFDLVGAGRAARDLWSARAFTSHGVLAGVEELGALDAMRSRLFPASIVSGPGVSDFLAVAQVEDRARARALSGTPRIADARAFELACRLAAPGPKASQVSASECHEIVDYLLAVYASDEKDAVQPASGDERDVVSGGLLGGSPQASALPVLYTSSVPVAPEVDPPMKDEYDFRDGVRGLFYRSRGDGDGAIRTSFATSSPSTEGHWGAELRSFLTFLVERGSIAFSAEEARELHRVAAVLLAYDLASHDVAHLGLSRRGRTIVDLRRLGHGFAISTAQLQALSEFAMRAGRDPDARALAGAVSAALSAFVSRSPLSLEARRLLETMPFRERWRAHASALAADAGVLVRVVDVESGSMADGATVVLSAADVAMMREWRSDVQEADSTPIITGIVERLLSDVDLAAERRSDVAARSVLVLIPLCAQCGERTAVCVGAYEGAEEKVDEPACGECCGHGNEDGRCRPIGLADVTLPWQRQDQIHREGT